MAITIALAGNPNSGKTTLFNALTGSAQFVGNWPGVTVEKKEGKLKGHKDVSVMDLPGIYSLSPYTLEEVVSRNYLINERPDVILNIVDGTNIERNLYLTTQLTELGIPVVVAVNMMDVVKKNGDDIKLDKLSAKLGCPVVAISALRSTGIDAAVEKALNAASGEYSQPAYKFCDEAEKYIDEIIAKLPSNVDEAQKRYFAIKLFEGDEKIQLDNAPDVSVIVSRAEEEFDDDAESIITSERYSYIASVIKDSVKKKRTGGMSTSDKIDRIVTHRVLALPIFIAVMWLVYTISIGTIGDWTVGFMNDTLFGEWIVPGVTAGLEAIGCADWLVGLVADGIVGGVGAVLGFVPQMLILFLMLCILEDIGYMARVAFIMDRIFRKFGLSGKSFIPMLVASGCGVPGIMASRTIEQDRDRKMTIMTTGFIPCGAKMPIVGLIAAALFDGGAWVATSAYFIGIMAVIVSGIMLKKTKLFAGDPAPFVMELPAYHAPTAGNVLRGTWERGWSFIKRAGSVIVLASIVIWVLNSLSFDGGFHYITEENAGASILEFIGGGIAVLFAPLGFGNWQAAVATVLGLVAKEGVVSTFGSLSSMADGDLAMELVEAADSAGLAIIGQEFFDGSKLAAFSFMVFNLLCAPCFAAMGAIKREMNNAKWTWFAIGYMCVFAYAVSLAIYQIGMLITTGSFGIATVAAFAVVAFMIYMLFRKPSIVKTNDK